MTRITKALGLLLLMTIGTTALTAQNSRLSGLRNELIALFGSQQGDFALAFHDLQTGDTLYINPHLSFHAASTMKTPVLMEAYRQAEAGQFKLTDSITIVNEFTSIADGSKFTLDSADDSEFSLYQRIGQKATVYDLLYQMIIYSSNLATNIIIEKVGAGSVMATMQQIGAKELKVLRGVEDDKAYAKGMNNTVTAFDLCLLFEKLGKRSFVSRKACDAMVKILLDQKFNEVIPAKLPADVKVAHKTGFITGVQHDSGLVFLPDGRKYVLVILSKNLADRSSSIEAMAKVSLAVYQYMLGQ
jgi:beta-lactamase class A